MRGAAARAFRVALAARTIVAVIGAVLRSILVSAFFATASLNAQSSLNALPEIEFSQLSQRDPNPLGEKALAINPDQWKHAETDHFIYHFIHSYVVTPVSIEAEFHYRVIAKKLERDQPAGDTKSHIYIFERPEDWQQFQSLGALEPWTGGIHSQGSLFIVRNPAYKFTNNSLGHEISHLLLHRFYSDGVPCWLDEGFAQYVSKDAHASYERARGYIARPQSNAIAAPDLISLAALVAMTHPPDNRVAIFYDESEKLVRFLATTDKQSFLALLDALARHQPFESSFLRIYAGRFANLAVLEEKFREYAAKDFGTTLQQADAD
jgi:peptidase MA superfamily protein